MNANGSEDAHLFGASEPGPSTWFLSSFCRLRELSSLRGKPAFTLLPLLSVGALETGNQAPMTTTPELPTALLL